MAAESWQVLDPWADRPVLVERLRRGLFRRDNVWLLQSYRVRIPEAVRDAIGGPEELYMPYGFTCDGRSTTLLPSHQSALGAAIAHDLGYGLPRVIGRWGRPDVLQAYLPLPRRWWDMLYYYHLAAIARELPWLLARPANSRLWKAVSRAPQYYAVRTFGGLAWERR